MADSICHNDDSFGPMVHGCRGDSDFTIRFELVVLLLIPSAIFITLSVPRALQLLKRPLKLRFGLFAVLKMVSLHHLYLRAAICFSNVLG